MAGLDFDSFGRLIGGFGEDSSSVARTYLIDKATGANTLIGSIGVANSTLGLAGISFGRPTIKATTPLPPTRMVIVLYLIFR